MIGAQLSPAQSPHVDSRLIAANSIIQLSTIELEQAVIKELNENPALELVERPVCPVCAGPLRFGWCSRCSGVEFAAQESGLSSIDPVPAGSEGFSAEDVDPLASVSAPLTLSERLFEQLRLSIETQDHGIALFLVGNLDEHGYLTLEVEEIAQALSVESARVQAVLEELQKLEPIGVGARNLAECLLLQADYLAAGGTILPRATRAIIQQHLEALGRHQFERICASLDIPREEVEEAFLFIRTNLHPYPAYRYYPQIHSLPSASPLLIPSVIIHRSATSASGYDIEIVESQRFLLRLNPLYQQIRHSPELALSPGELEHINHFLERARLFLSQLQRRSLLLRNVTTYLVHCQRDFLDYGPLHLRPLTQKSVAQALHIHVSTVSRAVAGKFAQLPSRELIPLNRFFSAEVRVQELIRQIILSESEPLSDNHIARLLSEQHEITLSRQMVANYRTGLGIPSARQRAMLRKG